MKWYLHGIRNYANFDDRASRTEYWMFSLFNLMFALLFFCLDLSFKINFSGHLIGPLYLLYFLFSIIPSLAIAVRRLHDVGKSGSYLFLALIPLAGLYLIALYCTESEDDENDYGDQPVNSDIAEFIYDSKTSTTILIAYLFWIFLSKIIWSFMAGSSLKFYESSFYKYFSLFSSILWLFSPLFLALSVRNFKWKIILLVVAALYMIYGFYEFVKAFALNSNNFQF